MMQELTSATKKRRYYLGPHDVLDARRFRGSTLDYCLPLDATLDTFDIDSGECVYRSGGSSQDGIISAFRPRFDASFDRLA